jgi:membrane-associated phospholipid phosphatase
MFGVSFRKGLILAHMILWAALLTDLFKNLFEWPRPYQIDPGVRRPDLDYAAASWSGEQGERTGIRTLVRRLLDSYGQSGAISHGFPSGHVSSATTAWEGLSIISSDRRLQVIAIPLIVAVALSRMYLGRHFLADVIGGFVLGGLVVGVHGLLIRGSRTYGIFTQQVYLSQTAKKSTALAAYLLLISLLYVVLAARADAEEAGRLLGLNVAFLLVSSRGFPVDGGSGRKRAARVALGLLFLILTRLFFWLGMKVSPLEDDLWFRFTLGFVSYLMLIWATVEIGSRLRLFAEH